MDKWVIGAFIPLFQLSNNPLIELSMFFFEPFVFDWFSFFLMEVRRLESAVRIELRIIKNDVECTVAKCSAGWIEIKFRDRFGFAARKVAVFGIKLHGVKSLCERRRIQLLMKVLFAEQEKVVRHAHNPSSVNIFFRISIRSDDC
jgi:hypothetical protein